MKTRKAQRHHLRHRLKKAISPKFLEWASLQACQFILRSSIFKQSQHIACYWPMHYEANCHPIIQACHQNNQYCYLPVTDPDKPRCMQFRLYSQHMQLQFNSLGIGEPCAQSSSINPLELDLVIMPLLGFDKHGYRLGQGGGYFDTTFAQTTYSKPPYLWGLALALQQVDNTYPEPWDLALEEVVTEQGFLSKLAT